MSPPTLSDDDESIIPEMECFKSGFFLASSDVADLSQMNVAIINFPQGELPSGVNTSEVPIKSARAGIEGEDVEEVNGG